MRYLRTKSSVGLMVMLVLLASVALLRADPGDLDLTFGDGDGYVTTDFGFHDWAFDLVIDAANRLVVAGNSSEYGVIVRYNPDGTLDTTFGDEGKVLLDFFPLNSYLMDIAIDGSGRIVVVGMDGLLARFNTDGSPDLSFGDQGFVFGAPSSVIHIMADNKIVTAGGTTIARYNTDGSIDNSFGYNGYIPSFGEIVDLLVSEDGNELILLIEYDVHPDEYIMLFKLNSDGMYDPDFGDEGIVITEIDENNHPRAAAWDADGNIVITGFVGPDNGRSKLMIARYLPDGSLDSSFADQGIETLEMWLGIEGHSLNIDSASRMIVTGTTYYELPDTSVSAMAFVARYLPDGELDVTFGGGDGLVSFIEAMGEDVVLDAAENIVIAGLAGVFHPPARDFLVARFQGGDLPATATPTPTDTPTATETIEPTATMTATNTLPPTQTATDGPTLTATATDATSEPTTTGTPDGSIDIVVNGGFETDLTGWQSKNLLQDKVKCDKPGKPVAYEGNCAFRFKGSVGENSQLFQKPELVGQTFNVGDVFTLGAYIKAKGQVDFRAQAKFTYADETKAKIALNVIVTDGYMIFADDYALTDAKLVKVKVTLKNKTVSSKIDVDAVSLWYTAGVESSLLPLP